MSDKAPALFPVGQYLLDELESRGWSVEDLSDAGGLSIGEASQLVLTLRGTTWGIPGKRYSTELPEVRPRKRPSKREERRLVIEELRNRIDWDIGGIHRAVFTLEPTVDVQVFHDAADTVARCLADLHATIESNRRKKAGKNDAGGDA